MDGLSGVIEVADALAQENRVRILMLLRGRELSVTEITGVLGVDLSTVSRHLGILRRAGLLESQRDAARILYRRAGLRGNRPLQQIVSWVERRLEADAMVARDAKAAKKVRKRD